MTALLLRGRRNPWHRLTIPSIDGRRIADDEDLRMARSAEVRLHFNAIGVIGRHSEPIGSGRGSYAGSPEDDLRRQHPVINDDAGVGAFANRATEFNLDSQPLERGMSIGG